MSAADFNIDILLHAGSIVEGQVVAAIGLFQINLNTLGDVGIGCAIVAAHSAGEVVDSALLSLIQTQLVGSTNSRIGNVVILNSRINFLYAFSIKVHTAYVIISRTAHYFITVTVGILG